MSAEPKREEMRILVTGGSGFLGSHFIRLCMGEEAIASTANLDLLTYAGDRSRNKDVEDDPRYGFFRADIADREAVDDVFDATKPDLVVHFAAESHVTRGESAPDVFRRTNLEGTRVLLEAATKHSVDRFVHISTDEVYGSIDKGAFTEDQKLPGGVGASSAYSKSKAEADDLALAFSEQLPVVVARPTNAFGPWQFPEKAFPRWVTRALRGEPMLVWGDGLYVRQWLFAEDFAQAIWLLSSAGVPGEAYNVGPVHEPEITNLELADWLKDRFRLGEGSVVFTEYDRPDHDRRYAVDPSKIQDLGWRPGDVWEQLGATADWYSSNRNWWERHIETAESIYTDSTK